jgi:hypothetical protein
MLANQGTAVSGSTEEIPEELRIAGIPTEIRNGNISNTS